MSTNTSLVIFLIKVYSVKFIQQVPNNPYVSINFDEKRLVTPSRKVNGKICEMMVELLFPTKLKSLAFESDQQFQIKVSVYESHRAVGKDSTTKFAMNILPDVVLGETLIKLTSSRQFIINWFPIKKGNETEIGSVLLGIFPTEYLPDVVAAPLDKSWFGFNKKKVSEDESYLRDFICLKLQFVVFVFIACLLKFEKSDSAKLSADLMKVLELCKTDAGRQLFVKLLRPSKIPQEVPLISKPMLVDIFKATLRHANNQKEYATCKSLLDLSMLYYFTDTINSTIRDHEVFKNTLFWDMSFLDVYPIERQRLVGLQLLHDNERASLWNHMNDKEREYHASGETALSVHLCRIYAGRMISSNVPEEIILEFLRKIYKMQDVILSNQIQLNQFVLDILNCKCFSAVNLSHAYFENSIEPVTDAMSDEKDAIIAAVASNVSSDQKNQKKDVLTQLRSYSVEKRDENYKPRGGSVETIETRPFSTGITYVSSGTAPNSRPSTPPAGINSDRIVDKRGFISRHMLSSSSLYYFHDESNNTTFLDFPPGWSEEHKTSKSFGGQVQITQQPKLVIGEFIVRKLDHCNLYNALNENAQLSGNLYLTNYALKFMAHSDAIESNHIRSSMFEIPVHAISSVDIEISFEILLNISTKDFRFFRFGWNSVTTKKDVVISFVDLVFKYAYPENIEKLFAFSFRESVHASVNGFYIYDVYSEFERQGAFTSKHWSVSDINFNFDFSPTYPSHLVVPTCLIGSDDLNKIKSFRSKGRIPALSYYHWRNSAVILRCSQPMTGVLARRCSEDESFLKTCRVGYILDARPKANAVGNQALGGGYEDISCYDNCSLLFMNIPNIHVIRESLNKVISLCADCSNISYDLKQDWWSLLGQTSWLKHCQTVLLAAVATSRYINTEGRSVLVHCSDGWDRTSQMCALSQVLLDPFYRTIKGFEVLIEKDWVSFGHKFSQRIGHGEKHTSDERSPVFIQFLDCVYQVLQQFACSFEFNSSFLEFIADHVYSCKFGTFLCDSEEERSKLKLKNKTVSLWTYCNSPEYNRKFLNPFYLKNNAVLDFNCDTRLLILWPYYYRWDRCTSSIQSFSDRAASILELERAMYDTKLKWLHNKEFNSASQLPRDVKNESPILSFVPHSFENELKSQLNRFVRQDSELSTVSLDAKGPPPLPERSKGKHLRSPSIPPQKLSAQNIDKPATNLVAVAEKQCSGNVTVPIVVNGVQMVDVALLNSRELEWQKSWDELEKDRQSAYERITELETRLLRRAK